MKHPIRKITGALVVAGAVLTSMFAGAHGNVVPQAVDTKGLPPLGEKWRDQNPYSDNKLALKIGASAYNQNCARCHGIEAISGGIAPDLRLLYASDYAAGLVGLRREELEMLVAVTNRGVS